MSVSLGTRIIGEASYGTRGLVEMSVGSRIVWQRALPNSMELQVSGGTKDLELPLDRYLTTEWTVDWGDGVKEKMGVKHSYTDGSSYHIVRISGSAMWGVNTAIPASVQSGLMRVSNVVGTCPIRAWRYNSFKNCTGLLELHEDMFNGVVVQDGGYAAHTSDELYFYEFCRGATKLSGGVDNLFVNAASVPASVKEVNFVYAFYGTKIAQVPRMRWPGAMRWGGDREGVINLSNAFGGCTGLVRVDRLFEGAPATAQAVALTSAFAGCTNLGANEPYKEDFANPYGIAENVFLGMPAIGGAYSGVTKVDMSFCFSGCSGLRFLPGTILSGVPNDGGVALTSMFDYCRNIDRALPEVWNTHGGVRDHSGFYRDCSKAPNYGSVPEGWK